MGQNSTEVQRQTGTACDLQFEHLPGVVVITAFRKWNTKLELLINFFLEGRERRQGSVLLTKNVTMESVSWTRRLLFLNKRTTNIPTLPPFSLALFYVSIMNWVSVNRGATPKTSQHVSLSIRSTEN